MARRSIVALTILAALPIGCRERRSRRAAAPPQEALAFTLTPGGVPVHFPAWMFPAAIGEAELAIDASGVPAGWTVEVAIPYFAHPTDPTRLLQGLAYLDARHIVVGIRAVPCNGEPILPALAHEVDHALHPEDPCYGHPAGDCE